MPADPHTDLTVTQMRRLVERAEEYCRFTGSDPDETPYVVGYVGLEPPSDEAIERGKRLAAEHGW